MTRSACGGAICRASPKVTAFWFQSPTASADAGAAAAHGNMTANASVLDRVLVRIASSLRASGIGGERRLSRAHYGTARPCR